MTDIWTDRIANHRVNERITKPTKPYPKPPRARRIVDEFQARLAKIDAERVPLSALENVASYLDQLVVNVQNYITDRNLGHLAQADTQIDNIVASMGYLPSLPARQDASLVLQTAKNFARRIQEQEKVVRESFEQLLNEIEAERSANEKAGSELDARLTDFGTNAEAKLGELRSEIDQQKIRLDEALNSQQATFAELQKGWLKDFADAEKSRDDAFREKTAATIAGAQKDIQALKTEATEWIGDLEAHEQKARQITGVAAASAVVGAYRETAGRERRQSDIWRLLGVGLFSLLLIVSPFAVLVDPPDEGSSTAEVVTFAVSRLPLFLGVTVALYATRQSSEHRKREEKAEHRALELTAFHPFLASLPEEAQHRLTEDAQRRFVPGDTVSTS
ncbi:MAG TPA: hypothetical protein VGR43_05690 [Dehalococcoidia bacterium]|nr:hypothetical protein [Dehalococcoidia bacterium]